MQCGFDYWPEEVLIHSGASWLPSRGIQALAIEGCKYHSRDYLEVKDPTNQTDVLSLNLECAPTFVFKFRFISGPLKFKPRNDHPITSTSYWFLKNKLENIEWDTHQTYNPCISSTLRALHLDTDWCSEIKDTCGYKNNRKEQQE